MSCCGTDSGITFGGETDNIFSFTITLTGGEQDVTTFEGGPEFLSCQNDSTISVSTYELINTIAKGDTVAFSANVCSSVISGSCIISQIDIPVAAVSPPTVTYTGKITGDLVGI